jgi:hypothetical protein
MADGCLVGIYSDVTDLKAEEARLRQRELAHKSRLLQSTLDTIDHGIAVSMQTTCWWPGTFATSNCWPCPLIWPRRGPLDALLKMSPTMARLCPPAWPPGPHQSLREPSLQGGSWSWRASRCPMAAS